MNRFQSEIRIFITLWIFPETNSPTSMTDIFSITLFLISWTCNFENKFMWFSSFLYGRSIVVFHISPFCWNICLLHLLCSGFSSCIIFFSALRRMISKIAILSRVFQLSHLRLINKTSYRWFLNVCTVW